MPGENQKPEAEVKDKTPTPSPKPDLVLLSGQPIDIEVNGETYTLSPLSLDDYGAVEQWARQEKLNMLATALREAGMNDDYIADRIESKVTVKLLPKEINEITRHPKGQMFILFRSIRHHHPEITKDDLNNMLTVKEAINMVSKVLATGIIGDPKNLKKPGGKKSRK